MPQQRIGMLCHVGFFSRAYAQPTFPTPHLSFDGAITIYYICEGPYGRATGTILTNGTQVLACFFHSLGFHSFQTFPTKSGPGLSVESPGFQPAGVASAPLVLRTC